MTVVLTTDKGRFVLEQVSGISITSDEYSTLDIDMPSEKMATDLAKLIDAKVCNYSSARVEIYHDRWIMYEVINR